MSDEDKKILEGVKETLQAHGYKDYDELRSAVESKRMLRELHGLRRAKWTSWIASFGAIASGIAAVATVLILLDRSKFEEENTYNEFVEREKAFLEGQRDNAKKERRQADADLERAQAERKRLLETLAELQGKRDELNAGITRDNERLVELREQLSDASAQITEQANTLATRGASAAEQRRSLERLQAVFDDRSAQAQREISQLSTRLDAMNATLKTQDKTVRELTVSADHLKKLAYGDSLQTDLSYRGSQFDLGKAADGTALYRVTLTNVGNVKENVDLEIVSVAGGSSTNLVNLDSGRKYAAAFNDNLFLIDVQEAVRSDVRAEERGRFSITVLGADYRLVY